MAVAIGFRASAAARQTYEYRGIRAAFDDCLRRAGYEPDTESWGPKGIGSNEGGPTSEEIKAAVTTAKCNQDNQVTQRMGNLEASFEAPLIRESQSALNTEKQRIREMEIRVDEFLRTHG